MQPGQVNFGSERVHHNILSVAAPMMAAQYVRIRNIRIFFLRKGFLMICIQCGKQ